MPRWHGGRGMGMCVCVCICACWHVFCLYVDGVAVEGVGVLGTGEINQCLAGKQPSFCPLCFPSSPPPPPTATLSLHVFDPSIVWRCTSSCGRLHPNKMQGRHLFIEKKLKYTRLNARPFITDWPYLPEGWNGAAAQSKYITALFSYSSSFHCIFDKVLSCCAFDVCCVHSRLLVCACSIRFSLIYSYL